MLAVLAGKQSGFEAFWAGYLLFGQKLSGQTIWARPGPKALPKKTRANENSGNSDLQLIGHTRLLAKKKGECLEARDMHGRLNGPPTRRS
jgi:hypothetical protein